MDSPIVLEDNYNLKSAENTLLKLIMIADLYVNSVKNYPLQCDRRRRIYNGVLTCLIICHGKNLVNFHKCWRRHGYIFKHHDFTYYWCPAINIKKHDTKLAPVPVKYSDIEWILF